MPHELLTADDRNMTKWNRIACERGCAEHFTVESRVHLDGPTPHADLPPIPRRLVREFPIKVWDPFRHPVDRGIYCPARSLESEVIVGTGCWEQVETIVTLDLLSPEPLGGFIDIGANLGYFSLLAQACHYPVLAVEADEDNLAMLRGNIQRLSGEGSGDTLHARIGVDPMPPPPTERTRLVKIDIEGAEPEAVDWLWPSIESGNVDALLIELSPVFHDGYPALAWRLVSAGYRAYSLTGIHSDAFCVEPGQLIDQLDAAGCRMDGNAETLHAKVASVPQQNVLFIRPERY